MAYLNKKERKKLKMRQQKENPVPCDYLLWCITNGPICKLLEVGKGIHSTEYAVRYYRNPRHTKFHNNKEALRHALRKEFENASHWRKHYFFDVLYSYNTFRQFILAQSASRRRHLLSQFNYILDEKDIQYITELNHEETEAL